MENENKVAILVSSCDAFADCWKPFLKAFNDCWSDCPYPVYIISNGKSIDTGSENIHILNVGEDKMWGTNTLEALDTINAQWIIYLQEDYFLENKISNDVIKSHVEYCAKHHIDYLRLSYPFFEDNHVEGKYFESPYTQRYAICLQAALWNKYSFMSSIKEGWSGWDFEHNIAQHLSQYMPMFKILGLSRSEWLKYGFKYVDGTAVRKGRWTRAAVSYLKANGFNDLVSRRPIEGRLLSFFQENRTFPGIFLRAGAKIMNTYKWNF